MLYPWQEQQWKQLWQWRLADRLPHALLLYGQEGMGKTDFALTLAQSLLCRYATEKSPFCGRCEDCHLMKGNGHPNFYSLTLEDKEKTLPVDKVRDVLSFVQIKAEGARVVFIHPAEAMNIAASNALLKSLEEPGEGVYFILVSHRSVQLPVTVKSRCQKILFPTSREKAISWLADQGIKENQEKALALTEGAPLLAQKIMSSEFAKSRYEFLSQVLMLLEKKASPTVLAEEWQDTLQKEHLFSLATLFMDMARYSTTMNTTLLVNDDFVNNIKMFTSCFSLDIVTHWCEKTLKTYELFLSRTNTNLQLLLEDFFVDLKKETIAP